jgi:hypothetical protein
LPLRSVCRSRCAQGIPAFGFGAGDMKTAYRFVLARLGEISTWKGAFLLLTAAGVTLAPEMQNAIVTVGLAVVGALGVASPDPAAQ